MDYIPSQTCTIAEVVPPGGKFIKFGSTFISFFIIQNYLFLSAKAGEHLSVFVFAKCAQLPRDAIVSQLSVFLILILPCCSVIPYYSTYTTRSQYKGNYLSGRIQKNLTLCRIHEFFFSKIP